MDNAGETVVLSFFFFPILGLKHRKLSNQGFIVLRFELRVVVALV